VTQAIYAPTAKLATVLTRLPRKCKVTPRKLVESIFFCAFQFLYNENIVAMKKQRLAMLNKRAIIS